MFFGDKIRKNFLVVFLSIFIISNIFLFIPKRANAVGAIDVLFNAKWTWEKVGKTALGAAMGSAVHAASYFMRKLAYDSAVWIASGGSGQSPLAFVDSPGEYFKNVALDSAADMLNEFAKPFGLGLCSTPDITFQPNLIIGMRSVYDSRAGKSGGPSASDGCSWQKMKDSWSAEAFEEKYGPGGSRDLINTLHNSVRFEDSDFGVALGLKAKVDRAVIYDNEGAYVERLEGDGFKPVTDALSGKIKTPAATSKKEAEAITEKEQTDMTMTQLAGMYGSSLEALPIMAVQVFLNTLASEGLKNLRDKLLSVNWSDEGSGDDNSGVFSYDSAGFSASRKKAESVFFDILTINVKQLNEYNAINEFISCPDDPIKRGLNNCVMDSSMKLALDQAGIGEPLTIREAIEEGYLNADWILVNPKRENQNMSKDCYNEAYCYSNLQKLRRNRILPLGFEVAALQADPDNPQENWTLGQVVAGFYDCPEANEDGEIVYDRQNYPYCHLIDPNWILKAPATKCGANVYSTNLIDNSSGLRAEECVDIKTCIKEDDSGQCEFYGYCTREEDIWRFPTDSCEEQYDTCETVVSSGGEVSSYILNTVDYGECNYSNIGCQAYSAEQLGGQWINSFESTPLAYKLLGRNTTVYFNEKVDNYLCNESNEGCSELKNAYYDKELEAYVDSGVSYLKVAPDYLGCYDSNLQTLQIDWPQNQYELNQIEENSECFPFASVCIPQEVGCDNYSPVSDSGALNVDAIIGEENYCESQCNGYDVFRQTGTNFEESEFPLYFIPDNGEICSGQYAGCDEFTNIDAESRGGESLEHYTNLKYCEKPAEDNQKVFYTWEGSANEGYVLKKHNIKPISQSDYDYIIGLNELDLGSNTIEQVYPSSSPSVISYEVQNLNGYYNLCNEDNYNNLINTGYTSGSYDCRAYYDRDGEIYYRIQSKTVSISDDCHPLRKTNNNFYVDTSLDNSDDCLERSGYWDGNLCQVCYNGGFYESGSCVYWTIESESDTCPASANLCREYKGNSASDVNVLVTNSFEPISDDEGSINEITSKWVPQNNVRVSPEATVVGLNSIKLENDASYVITTSSADMDDFISGAWYEISFWAKGDNQTVKVFFEGYDSDTGITTQYFDFTSDIVSGEDLPIDVNFDWQQYRLGSFPIMNINDFDNDDEYRIRFEIDGDFYIDNLQMIRTNDKYYLIKDSWQTPEGYDVSLSCDSNPEDTLPGQALGCSEYTQYSTDNSVFLTGFRNICREEAVGCRAFFDSNNNNDDFATAYNVWCANDSANYPNKKCSIYTGTEENEIASCVVAPGEQGCFIDKIENFEDYTNWENVNVVESTIIVPADNLTEPIFLTNRAGFRCTDDNVGCTKFGLESKLLPDEGKSASYQYSDIWIINNPENYFSNSGGAGILCRDDLLGCEEYKSGNEVFYFKDPLKTGNTLCEYKNYAESGDRKYKGWFKKDVGQCSDDFDKLCSDSTDCGDGASCEKIGLLPCYDNFMQVGGEYGIWPNASDGYAGFVGLCPETKDGCTELVDPQGTSAGSELGKSYFVIYNNELENYSNDCGGEVSLSEGCVLFDKTDELNKVYNSSSTYYLSDSKRSARNPSGSVIPQSESYNDTNKLIKVIRDRECSEWLSCEAYRQVDDTLAENQQRNVCAKLMLCEGGDEYHCTDPVNIAEHKLARQRLDIFTYINRDVDWVGTKEFSGMSLFNQYQIFDLDFITSNSDDNDTKDIVLGKYVFADEGDEFDSGGCLLLDQNGKKVKKPDGEACFGGQGVCFGGRCIYPPKYEKYNEYKLSDLYNKECRGYPEEDAPFTDVDWFVGMDDKEGYIVSSWDYNNLSFKDPDYQEANLCQPGQDCSCDYLRVGYGEAGQVTEERFYNLDDPQVHYKPQGDASGFMDFSVDLGVCVGGEKAGSSCFLIDDDFCGDGTCSKKVVSQTRNIGWKGYCLERDYSVKVNARTDKADDAYACLTWLPLDDVPSDVDIYSDDPEDISYQPTENSGKYYCTEMLGVNNWAVDTNNEIYDNLHYIFDDVTMTNVIFNNGDYFRTMSNVNYRMPEVRGKNVLQTIQNYVWGLIDLIQNKNDICCDYQDLSKDQVENKNVILGDDDSNDIVNIKLILNGDHYGVGSADCEDKTEEGDIYVSRLDIDAGPNYLSRVDIGAYSQGEGDWGFAALPMHNNGNNEWDDPLNNEMQDLIEKEAEKPISIFMASQGQNNLPVAPLFIDPDEVEWFTNDANDPDGSVFKAGDNGNIKRIKDVQDFGNQAQDNGILLHRPTQSEKDLNQNFINYVSIIPLWPVEYGNDGANHWELPFLGVPMNIPVQQEYYEELQSEREKLEKEEITVKEFNNWFVDSVQPDYYKQSTFNKDSGNSEHSNRGYYWTFDNEPYEIDYFDNTNKKVKSYTMVWMYRDLVKDMDDYNDINMRYDNPDVLSGVVSCDPDSNQNNVFSKSISNEDELSYFIAVEVLFDSNTGEFLGYKTRSCNNGKDDFNQWGFATAVSFNLRPICLESVEVVDGDGANKARTNKVWLNSSFDELLNVKIFKTDFGTPFGSVVASNWNINDVWYQVFSDQDNENNNAGRPFTCYNNYGDCERVVFEEDNNDVVQATCLDGDYEEISVEHFIKKDGITYDTDYYLPESMAGEKLDSITDNSITKKRNILDDIFVSVYDIKRLNFAEFSSSTLNVGWIHFAGLYSAEGDMGSPLTQNIIKQYPDRAEQLGVPPTILEPLENYTDYYDFGGGCNLANNFCFNNHKNFKVSNFYSPEELAYGNKILTAELSFFAWADSDQMPIKRIMVNFDDGLTIGADTEGTYKNRKPACGDESGEIYKMLNNNLCSKENSGDSVADIFDNNILDSLSYLDADTLICSSAGKSFGDQLGVTCEEEPYKFSKEYFCYISAEQKKAYLDSDGAEAEGIVRVGDIGKIGKTTHLNSEQVLEWQEYLTTDRALDAEDFVCVYRPKVQVMDNWDWCTGDCDGDGEGCYGGDSNDKCDSDNILSWTNYQNIIIVSP